MPLSGLTPAEQRRLRWRHWIERRTVDRHPVSPTRQRVGIAALVAILLGTIWYSATTRDAAIRRRAIDFLQEVTAGDVEVSAANFSMFDGITLQNVRISTPFNRQLDALASDVATREIISARTIRLVHNPWMLLFGKLRVQEIVAVQPRITLVHNVDTGLRNWQFIGRPGKTSTSAEKPNRPLIRLRSAKAVVVSVYADGHRDSRMEELDADVRPHPTSDTGYCIEVRRFTDPADRVTVIFDPGARLVTNAPFVDARTVRLQLPMVAQQLFDRIDLQGEVKLTRLYYGSPSASRRDTEILLRNVRCRIPLSTLRSGSTSAPSSAPADSNAAGGDSAVTMTGVQGRIQLRGDRLQLAVTGQVNDATCNVEGTLDSQEVPLTEIGFDVRVTAAALPAPEGAVRERLLEDPSVPGTLRSIFADYDPHGVFDVDLQLQRPAGPQGHVSLQGTLKPLSVRAKHVWFPYTVTDLGGLVRFDGPIVHIEHLHGRHGPANIEFNGTVDQSRGWSQIAVDIEASSVPLDTELFTALAEKHRLVWQRFGPRGLTDLHIQLRRPSAGWEQPVPEWTTKVSAEPMGCVFSIGDVYTIHDVYGRLDIEGDQIRIDNLTGQRGDASIRIDGRAAFEPNSHPEAQLHIEAYDLAIDDHLASILPPEGQGAFSEFQPRGRVDLVGSILFRKADQTPTYDLRMNITDGLLCYQEFPYRVEAVRGEVLLRPEGVSIIRAEGRHGPTKIEVLGDVRRKESGFSADISFICDALLLDDDLYRAFPESFKNVWRLFNPSGAIQSRTTLHMASQDGRMEMRHRTHLKVSNGSARFSGLPLAVSDLSAEFALTDRRAEILSLRGTAAEGRIVMSGAVDLSGPRPTGVISLQGVGMTFNDEVFAALPAPLGPALRAAKADGQFDLQLDPIEFVADAKGRWQWNFNGGLRFRNLNAELGIGMHNAFGTMHGRGSIDSTTGNTLDLDSSFEQIVLAGWPLQQLSARLVVESPGQKLQIRDATAEAYGGQVTGVAEVDMTHDAAQYQASITAQGVQLDQYLQESASRKPPPAPSRKPSKPSPPARGDIYGNMIIRGRGGPGGYREGAGEVTLRAAQVWRLPLVFAIFQVLNLTPDENVFHDGRMKFFLSRDTLTFQNIDLQGKAISLLGGGRMDLRSHEMDVTLVAGSPVRIRVPFLTDVLEGASREFMQVRVRGTLESPSIEPQPLKSLNEVLKSLFPPPPKPIGPRPIEAAAPSAD